MIVYGTYGHKHTCIHTCMYTVTHNNNMRVYNACVHEYVYTPNKCLQHVMNTHTCKICT